MQNYAGTCLKVGWKIFLLGKLVLSVSEGTGISEETLSCNIPVPAYFGFKFRLVMFNKGFSFFLGIE